MKNSKTNSWIALAACLFIGFQPITEPHIIGKIKWIAGGAVDMQPMDWFDTAMHGIPLLIAAYLILKIAFSLLIKK